MAHHPQLPADVAKNNFAPASSRDLLVFGSSRPGFSPDNEKAGAVDDADVAKWVQDVKENDIKRVVCLLKKDELDYYKAPLQQQIESSGLQWTGTTLDAPGAADTIIGAFREAEKAGEKIVVHCSAGAQRTGLGLGLWLTTKYGLSPEEAAQEIAANAAAAKVVRSADPGKLGALLASAESK
eukprot:CAMPEP_0113690128 /NCGR_PEP_ID=MMETSP0038_2-20120614/17593_1 /TAXON_ID=2898 /ORGANISM="Cryptomonas paramecium" /LENGTH=181 /DNA_ID=CAMNT_0000611367 /DNA_START=1 /DNA_END=546 /DNA_ORIENTATION=+ /assembly_acc=CAM_ASM_000170